MSGEQLSRPIEDFKNFSKDHFQAERDKCAQEVITARANYHSAKRLLQRSIEQLENGLPNTLKTIREIQEDIDRIQSALSSIKASRIKSFLLGWKLNSMQANLSRRERSLEYFCDEAESVPQRISDMQLEIERETEVKRYKQIFSNFISDQRRYYDEYVENAEYQAQVARRLAELSEVSEEERVRDLRYVSNRYQALFVHAIMTSRQVPIGTARVKPETTTLSRIKIVIAMQPCVCTSTLRQGEGADLTVDGGAPGLIIADGNINLASPIDSFTKIHEDGARIAQYSSLSEGIMPDDLGVLNDVTPENIERAMWINTDTVMNRQQNEFGVENAVPGAIYIPIIRDHDHFEPITGSDDLCNFAEKIGLPAYFISQGKWYSSVKVESENRWKKGYEILLPDILKNLGHVSTAKRLAIGEEIMAENPFAGEEMPQ